MFFFRFLIRRVLYVIPMIFVVTLIVFSLILLIPGDPVLVLLGENATAEKVAQLKQQLGLDKPIIVQYFYWLTNAIQGDLGRSIFTSELVSEVVFQRLLVTLQLVIAAMIIAITVGIFLAIMSVYYFNTWIDYFVRLISTLGIAVPHFLFAMILVILFSLKLNWLPATGFTSIAESPSSFLQEIALPAFSLSIGGIALITRHLRSALLEALDADYIRTAYSKGASRWQALFKHGLQNAMLPVVTTIGLLFGNTLGATVVIESIFAIPGMGQLAVGAILQRDFTMVQGVVLVMFVMVIVINLITDIVYALLDPRIEY
ncbi:ABC transporter permease [Geobacillus zalihae]|uniref:ABC transporter permease n=1 Tax=Geobacillus zalihae TaxID=213419 RepID=UPI0016818D64|nr:ABC transporter permease [Geobacillus zalihae]QNU25924.1 ABC transporter permease [Geobacillus zalihae]